MAAKPPFESLYEALKAGTISRRQFIERATALGVGAVVATFCSNAAQVGASGGSRRNGWAVYAQQGQAKAPDAGTEGQQRGAGGELKLLQWQAPTLLATHSAVGTKDIMAAALITEPLMNYLEDGSIIPNLVTEVPSVENGLLSEDLKTVTYKLRPGVTWSDGEPFTAEDVVFTWQWTTHLPNNSVNLPIYQPLEKVEAVDELTAVITFKTPTAAWFEPFTGSIFGGIYPKHVFGDHTNVNEAFLQKPIGTGPYVVESFTPNDQAIFVMNENYREPTKPFFERINLKGGGDAAAAARAVLETGDWDYAWNVQVEPAILQEMEESGGKGKVVVVQGTNVERININFSDPNKEVEGQRSHFGTPHPMLADLKVRQALNLAVPRDTIANEFYFGQQGEPPTANILTGLESFTSQNTSWEYSLEKAAALLDEAGWVMDGELRKKDGQEFAITYSTSINPVRQKTQQVVKQSLEQIGIEVQLEQVDAGIFFDSAAGNEQNITHFYHDISMFTSGAASPVPISFMLVWYAGPDGSNIAQKENGWAGGANIQRYANEEYDRLFVEISAETDFERASDLLIQMNDILINDVALVPQVNRAADKYAISNTLRDENVGLGAFESNYWNSANWNRVS